MRRIDIHTLGPIIALIALVILGGLLNPAFLAPANISNVLVRSAFLGMIVVGMTFVISAGGLDLSVGSMAAFLPGIAILAMNALAPVNGVNWDTILIGMGVTLAGGVVAGLFNGLLIAGARIEPFIVTLGTMGIFRNLVTWLADGGTISLDAGLRTLYRPVYYGGIGWPFESEPLTASVKAVKDAGKWVTVVDRGLSEDGIEDLYVAGDNTALGRIAGEYFRDNLPAGAKIVVLRGIPTTLDNERVEAFQAALEGSDKKILDMQHGNWNRDDAFAVMQDYLAKYPQIDAVWAADDDMAMGVLEAIASARREGEMVVVGGAGMKEIVQRIMEGDPQLPVNVTYPPALISSAIEMTALAFASQAPMTGRFIIGSQLITLENAERFYFPDSPF